MQRKSDKFYMTFTVYVYHGYRLSQYQIKLIQQRAMDRLTNLTDT